MLLSVLMPLLLTLLCGWQKFRMHDLQGIAGETQTVIVLPSGEKAMQPGDEFYHGSEKYDVVSVEAVAGYERIYCVSDRLELQLELAMEDSGEDDNDGVEFKLFIKDLMPMQPHGFGPPAFYGSHWLISIKGHVPDPSSRAFFIPPEFIS